MISGLRALAAAVAAAVVFSACGGGGGGGGSTGGGVPPTAQPSPASSTLTALIGGSAPGSVAFPTIASGASASVTVAPSTVSGSATGTFTLQSSPPSGITVPQSSQRLMSALRKTGLGATPTTLAYITVSVNSSVTLSGTPAITFNYPGISGYVYAVLYAGPQQGWVVGAGPVKATSSSSVTIPSTSLNPPVTLQGGVTYTFAIVQNATPFPTPTPATGPLSGPTYGPQGNGWAPTAIANAFDFPVQHGYNGSGQTVAIVIDSPVDVSSLDASLAYSLLPPSGGRVRAINVNGGCTSIATCGGADEARLDVQTIAALAPGANVVVYSLPDLSNKNINDAYNQIASSHDVSVASSSFGGCDSASQGSASDPVFETGAAAGVAFVASAGDQGNECYAGQDSKNNAIYQNGPNWPATDPNVIGVGGNQTSILDVTTPNALTNPQVWNDVDKNFGTDASAGGGGVSAYAIPSFQSALHSSNAGVSATYRNVPDVTMPAEDAAIRTQGFWSDFRGTSWSAPEFAAMLAEIYQYCNGTASKNPVALPYVAYGLSTSTFIDVTKGDNRFNHTAAAPYYAAAAGFDDASGLGLPRGYEIATTVCPNHVPVASFSSAVRAQSSMRAMPAAMPIDVEPHVAGLVDRGVRAANAPTSIQIVVQPGPQAAMNERAVIETLQHEGFTIARTFPNHLVVDANGTAAQVNATFRTQLHDVVQGAFGTRYLPATRVLLPSTMSGAAARVILDNVVVARSPHIHS